MAPESKLSAAAQLGRAVLPDPARPAHTDKAQTSLDPSEPLSRPPEALTSQFETQDIHSYLASVYSPHVEGYERVR